MNILSQAHGSAFDAEFHTIADAELAGGAFSFQFPDLFKGNKDDKVSGLSVPLLHEACAEWISSAMAQPQAIDSAHQSAIGDTDRILAASGDHVDEEEKVRAKTITKTNEVLSSKMHMATLDDHAPKSFIKAIKERLAFENFGPRPQI